MAQKVTYNTVALHIKPFNVFIIPSDDGGGDFQGADDFPRKKISADKSKPVIKSHSGKWQPSSS